MLWSFKLAVKMSLPSQHAPFRLFCSFHFEFQIKRKAASLISAVQISVDVLKSQTVTDSSWNIYCLNSF